MNNKPVIPEPLRLSQALLVYRSTARAVIMEANINVQDGHISLDGGRPVTRALIESLLRLDRRATLTFVPPHVVAMGTNCFAWIVEPAERSLLFSSDDPALKEIDSQHFPQPRLLFIGQDSRMKVFALRGSGRPGPDEPLYCAPYFNIFDSHSVCIGSMALPGMITPDNCLTYSDVFFQSNFVRPSGSLRRWRGGMTHRELWDAAREAGHFKDEWLVPAQMKLGQALGGLQ